MKLRWAEELRDSVHELAESLGNLLVETFHYLALFAIGAVTAWAAVMAFLGMVEKGHITVDDILLLFIYLELGAMVGIYFKTNHMPVRFLIYVAITALTRLLISDVSHHHRPDMGVVYVSGAILLLRWPFWWCASPLHAFPPCRAIAAGHATSVAVTRAPRRSIETSPSVRRGSGFAASGLFCMMTGPCASCADRG